MKKKTDSSLLVVIGLEKKNTILLVYFMIFFYSWKSHVLYNFPRTSAPPTYLRRRVGLGRSLKQLTLAGCGVGGDLELMPGGVKAIYDKCTTTDLPEG